MPASEAVPSTSPRFHLRHICDGLRTCDALIGPEGSAKPFALPIFPQLLNAKNGIPDLSISLVLDHVPVPSEELAPLARECLLSMGLTLALPDWALSALKRDVQSVRPIFTHEVTFRLEREGASSIQGVTLAEASETGQNASAAVSCMLARDDALRLLQALEGKESGLQVSADVRWRGEAQVVRGAVLAAAASREMQKHADVDGRITLGRIRVGFLNLLSGDLPCMQIETTEGGKVQPSEEVVDALFQPFLTAARIFLRSGRGEDELNYRVSPLPESFGPMTLRIEATVTVPLQRTTLRAPLHEVLGETIEEHGLTKFVQLVARTESGKSFVDVPPATRGGSARATPDTSMLALRANRLTSLALSLHPEGARPIAGKIVSGALVQHLHGSFLSGDLVADSGIRNLPVVDDPNAPLWRDRKNPAQQWYAEELAVVRPTATTLPASSPFLFQLRKTGMVMGGGALSAGLEATVTFTLNACLGAATAAVVAKLTNGATAVPMQGITVQLELPFREKGTQRIRTQLFPATVEQVGKQVRATVKLMDDWARLCYIALAFGPAEQEPSARLRIGWGFEAYTFAPAAPNVALSGKIASTMVGSLANQPTAGVLFDPARRVLRSGNTEVHFQPEGGPGQLRSRVPEMAVASAKLTGVAHVNAPASPAHSIVSLSPDLAVASNVVNLLNQTKYVCQTIVKAQALDIVFPCSELGFLYRELSPDGDKAMGCQSALHIGEVAYRQFEEIPDLRCDRGGERVYSVLRSLQQPGRFLLAPARYRIGRFAPSAGSDSAFRPTAMVYALHDPAATATRYFFSAHLEPDIPYHVFRALLNRLPAFVPAGTQVTVDLPTEPSLQAKASFKWAQPDDLSQPEVLMQWDGFQVTVSTTLANAALLNTLIEKAGLVGEVTFTLPDGSQLLSTLLLDRSFTGPWRVGPIELTVSSAKAVLANRTEAPVDVFELLPNASQETERITVDATIDPGCARDVQVSGPAADPVVVAESKPGTGSIEELNIYVEDVSTNIIFVNLVAYANHAIARLSVEAVLVGTEHVNRIELLESQDACLDLQLPLTNYLERPVLRFRLLETTSQGEALATPWQEWDLERAGNVISITPAMVQQGTRASPAAASDRPASAEPGVRDSPEIAVTVRSQSDRKESTMINLKGDEQAKGISIHIGLNKVDPNAYDGWDGALSGCVNDANSMQEIADKLGYKTTILLDEQATADAVVEAIGKAAQELGKGDHFLLTYSGHGSQVDDDTGDEEDKKDETWVLYNRMLLDDELYALWSRFEDGVRIFMISDSCHSGTMLRAAVDVQLREHETVVRGGPATPATRIKLRRMPPEDAKKHFDSHRPFYRSLQWTTGGKKKAGVVCSAILISGCQDNQFSQDGNEHGLFTEKLLSVWNDGAFTGSHPLFHKEIGKLMPSVQTPNYMTVGAKNTDFEGMTPFKLTAEEPVDHEVTPEETPEAKETPTITQANADTWSLDEAPSFDINPSPYTYYAVEVATDPAFFWCGDRSKEETEDNWYGSWTDVHKSERGSSSPFTIPDAAWEKLKNADRLYFLVWATKNSSGDWDPCKASSEPTDANYISLTEKRTLAKKAEAAAPPRRAKKAAA